MSSKSSVIRLPLQLLTLLSKGKGNNATQSKIKNDVSNSNSNIDARNLITFIRKEPFFHFIILGALLFGFNEYLEARANHSRIDISKDQIQGIINNYQLQYGGKPTPDQLKSLVDSYIREEVFYHEALRLNLDKDDEIIRRRLVQKYEFLQQDLGIPKEPAESDLLAFYKAHADKYLIPEKVTFSHIYFSTDQRGESGAKAAAQKTLEQLVGQDLTRAPDAGDSFPGLYDYANLGSTEVARLFGNQGLGVEVFNQPLNRWAGPFRSGYGWHLVYVSSKEAAHAAPFDVVKDAVQRDYNDYHRGLRNAEVLEKLKKSFTIVVEK